MTTSTPIHPADTIAFAPTFTEAVNRYITACEYEAERAQRDLQLNRRDSFYEDAATAHGVLYIVSKLPESRAIDILSGFDQTKFADALESGDYSKLSF